MTFNIIKRKGYYTLLIKLDTGESINKSFLTENEAIKELKKLSEKYKKGLK